MGSNCSNSCYNQCQNDSIVTEENSNSSTSLASIPLKERCKMIIGRYLKDNCQNFNINTTMNDLVDIILKYYFSKLKQILPKITINYNQFISVYII